MPVIAELADGRRLEFPDGTDPAVVQRTVKGMLAPEPADTEVAINAGNKGIAGVPDALLNTPNKLMNLGKAAFGTAATAMGRTDLAPELTPDPNYASRGMKALGFIRDAAEPVNARQRVIDTMAQGATSAAMNPAGTGRQLAQNVATAALGGGAGQATTEATGSEALGQSVGLLTPLAASPVAGAVGNRARQKIADLEAERQGNSVRDKTLAEAREQGYKFPRSATQDTLVNNMLESFAGKDALKQKMTIGNQAVTNRLTAEELGLPRGTAITEGVLERFRDLSAQPYREVASMSPVAEAALERLKKTRFDLKTYANHANRTGDPTSVQTVDALKQRADMLETALERMASRSGNPDLVDRLRAARVNIAKSYDIERSMNVGNAEISAPDLGAMRNRRKEGGMTGNLDLIARTQQNASRFMGEGSKTPAPGVSHLDSYGSALSAIGGSMLGGATGGIAGAVALPAARRLTRAALMSDFLQKRSAPDYKAGIPTRAAATLESQTPTQQLIQSILLERAMAERQ
jgi:hypothetical protein